MRENMGVYRGKTEDGKWVRGWFLPNNFIVTSYIFDGNEELSVETAYPVVPETVGQWTGLTDERGEQIFEGDIVKEVCLVNGNTEQGTVYFNDIHLQFLFNDYSSLLKCSVYEREVIGNIHDNPELRKE